MYVEQGINLDMIEDSDLIAMLGNLFDNALRASLECGYERYIKIHIFMQEIGGYCIIKMTNAFSGKIIMKDGNFVTSKIESRFHGLGIKSVNRMAEKYGGYLNCSVKGNVFEAVVLLSTLNE